MVVMKYVKAKSLKQVLENVSEDEKKMLVDSCKAAVSCLHNHGFCHGDVRPANILVKEDMSIQIIDWAGGIGT